MEELELSPYYTSAIAFLVALVVVLFYLLLKKEDKVKKSRRDSESEPETAKASDAILERIKMLDQDMETRLKELGARINAANEVEKLRQEIESRFNIRFEKEAFTENDLYSFLFTVSNALYRFDRETRSREADENLITEARGYIAILNLVMAWARANGNDMVRKKVTELMPRAEAAFKRMNEL